MLSNLQQLLEWTNDIIAGQASFENEPSCDYCLSVPKLLVLNQFMFAQVKKTQKSSLGVEAVEFSFYAINF